MPTTTVFPPAGRPRPAGTIIRSNEKLKFTLATETPAPIFAFFVDSTVEWDQESAARQSTATANTFSWNYPTNASGRNQIQTLLLKATVLDTETYTYRIEKVADNGIATTLLEEKMSGAGTIVKSDFELGIL